MSNCRTDKSLKVTKPPTGTIVGSPRSTDVSELSVSTGFSLNPPRRQVTTHSPGFCARFDTAPFVPWTRNCHPGRFDHRYSKLNQGPSGAYCFVPCIATGSFQLNIKIADAKVRILVVDDNESFLRFVTSTFRDRQNLTVVGEAGDGLEAVQRAEALQPDLILLDIGLPERNGLEAARQISRLAPNARIIFLTQESAPDVVAEALSLGAWGYVAKVQAGRDLMVALDTVLQGQRFVSSSLNGHK